MARCEECSHFDLCEALEKGNGLMKVHPIHCGFYKPTADVAPKSEVAREIFEEIEKVIGDKYESYVFDNNDLDSIEQDAIINFSDDLSDSFEEIKKKYTEEKE